MRIPITHCIGDTMKKDIAKLWTKALRSGKYKQGKHTLRNHDNSFCCLGVLCDLYNKEQKKKKKKTLDVIKINCQIEGKCYKYGPATSYLPVVVKKWAGMKTTKGEFFLNDYAYNLAGFNDGDYDTAKSFKSIAKIIDDNVDQL
jgi:hypothetical protein